MQKVLKVKRISKTLRVEKHNLLNGKNTPLDVGSWVKFTNVGRIVKLERSIGSSDVKVVVEMKSYSYSFDSVEPVVEVVYECGKCGLQFASDDACFEHFETTHTRKAKPRKR